MISDKNTVLSSLEEAISQVTNLVEPLSEDRALAHPILDKWSVAEQLVHLIVATRAVGKALGMPKLVIRAFGSSREGSRSYDELVADYEEKLAGQTGRTGFEPELRGKSWDEIREKWTSSGELFRNGLTRWSEKELDTRMLPHPLLGKITIREMLFFTHHHIHHHRKSIEALIERLSG